MEKVNNKITNTIKKYKERIIIEKLNYKELNIDNLEDILIIKRLTEFDTSKYCYGDYSLFAGFDEYFNYAIYLGDELIGYLAYIFSHPKDITRFIPCICLKEEYRHIGIGYIVIKQLMNTLFETFSDLKSIYVTALEKNTQSINLAKSIGFYEFPGYRENDYFLVNGKEEKQNHYLYKRKDYQKNKKNFISYGYMKIR